MKLILTITLAALLLSACYPSRVAPMPAVVQQPAVISTPTAYIPEVKEVAMATQTPVPAAAGAPAAATSVPGVDPSQPTPTSTSVVLPKTLEELGIAATTYEDSVAGLAFDYPASWIINAVDDEGRKTAVIYTASLRSYEAKPGPKQQEGIPADMAAIDVTVFKNGPKTYEQAINERRAAATTSESGQPVLIAGEAEWTLRGGLPAHTFLFNLGKDPAAGPDSRDKMAAELVTMINGRMVLVSGAGDLSMFNIVAASLRELK